jgi:hypothetical protein
MFANILKPLILFTWFLTQILRKRMKEIFSVRGLYSGGLLLLKCECKDSLMESVLLLFN